MAITPFTAEMITAMDKDAQVYSKTFTWPACVTCHTWQGHFQLGMKQATNAVWRVCWAWTKKSNAPTILRLVHADDGPANLVEIGRISTVDWKPGVTMWNSSIGWTAQFNDLVSKKAFKNVGWQVQGDGVSPINVYSSRLEIQFS